MTKEYILTEKGIAALNVLSKEEKLREKNIDFYNMLRGVESENKVEGFSKDIIRFALSKDYIARWSW